MSSDSLVAERLCSRLVFNETLVAETADSRRPNQLLESGCGGFYEVSSFAPEGAVSPRNVIHVHAKLAGDGRVLLTRLLLYSTAFEPVSGQAALVSSFVSAPVPVDPTCEVFSFECREADFVLCRPFWSDDGSKSHAHMRVNPSEYLAQASVQFDAVFLTIFREEGGWPTDLDGYSLDAQLEILEAPGMRIQAFASVAESTSPIWWITTISAMIINVDMAWLRERIARFEQSAASPHVIVRST